jgi:PhnB protein
MSNESEEETLPPIVPYLSVHDAKAAIAFYEAAFGATAHVWPHPDGRVAHAALRINGGDLYLSDEFPENNMVLTKSPNTVGATTCSIVLQVDDADVWWHRAVAAGATVNKDLTNEFYGRHGQLRDPFGHLWGILGPVP